MLIVLQFPLADLRPFLETESGRLPVLDNFSARQLADTSDFGGTAPEPFLRGVGPLRKRRQGTRYAGESLYFKGRRAIVFRDGLRTVPDPRDGTPLKVDVFFRRFQAFQELHQLARYELALLVDLTDRPALDAAAVEALLDACLSLPVQVPPDETAIPLIKAGPKLATSLLRAMTFLHVPTPPTWTMAARTPTVLVEYGTDEVSNLPKAARPVTLAEGDALRVAATGLRCEKVVVSGWFVCTGVAAASRSWFGGDVDAEQHDLVRQLRINLLRHHAEREVLAYTLDSILLPDRLTLHGPGVGSEALVAYLVKAAARLTRSQRFGLGQKPIGQALAEVEAAGKVVDTTNPGRYDELWQYLAKVLDFRLFTELYNALESLPMGSPMETATLQTLLHAERRTACRAAISYAHADDRLQQSFASHLETAVRNGMLEPWDDRWIVAGTDWQAEIDQRFQQAGLVVLLVSQAFLDSEYCMKKEVPLAFKRADDGAAAVVPVLVRPCKWEETPLKDRQLVRPHNRPVVECGNRTEAWRIVIHEILRAAHGLDRHPSAGQPKPAPGSGTPADGAPSVA